MNRPKGFTLIEFIIVIVLIAILGTMSTLMLRQTFKSYVTEKQINDLATQTNMAADNVLRELKSAGSLSAIGTSTLTFINQQGQTIVIDLNGTTLRRNVNSTGAQTLCNNITNLAFGFFDQAFATTNVATNVRFITIQLTATNNQYPYSLMGGTVLRRLLP